MSDQAVFSNSSSPPSLPERPSIRELLKRSTPQSTASSTSDLASNQLDVSESTDLKVPVTNIPSCYNDATTLHRIKNSPLAELFSDNKDFADILNQSHPPQQTEKPHPDPYCIAKTANELFQTSHIEAKKEASSTASSTLPTSSNDVEEEEADEEEDQENDRDASLSEDQEQDDQQEEDDSTPAVTLRCKPFRFLSRFVQDPSLFVAGATLAAIVAYAGTALVLEHAGIITHEDFIKLDPFATIANVCRSMF